MQIKMTQTRKGTQDGYTVSEFEAGKEYDVREHLAYRFLAEGVATKIEGAPTPRGLL